MNSELDNIANLYALSPTQQGMLYHTVSAKESGVYLVQMAVTLDGLDDPDRLAATLQQVCSRHEALRSFYVWEEVEQPLQIVRKEIEFPLKRLDWRNDDSAQRRRNLLALVKSNQAAGIDPSDAPLLRFFLCRCDDQKYVLLFFFHHLVLDGWSTQTLLTEIMAHYKSPLTEPPAFQFGKYIEHLSERDVDSERDFWKSELANFSKANHLGPPDLVSQSYTDQAQTSRFLSVKQTEGLRELAKANRVTLSTMVRALWSLTVSRFSGGDTDIVFGVTTAGRPPELTGIEKGIGSFINTIPFRTEIDANKRLGEWLQNIQKNHGRASQWETSSLAEIQRNAGVTGGQDLFQSILVFENYPQRDSSSQALSIVGTEHFEQSSYPLALLVVPNEQLEFIFVHDRNRFPDTFIERIAEQLQWLAERFVADPNQRLGLLSSVPPNQLAVANELASADVPTPCLIDQLFSEHAAYHPDDIAVAFKGQSLTYGELEVRSNQIANRLIDSGVGPDVLVGICLERSIEMLAGILGVLKAGGAYVPIDPSYPQAHIQHVVEDAGAQLVLTTQVYKNVLPETAPVIIFDDISNSHDSQRTPRPNQQRDVKNLAYLIYTSGSTGLPKGVKISHENLFFSNLARNEHYRNSPDAFLLLSSFSFDSSVVGIFWTLCNGGRLVLPEPDQEKDVRVLRKLIQQHEVSHLLCLPRLYELILDSSENQDQLKSLKAAIVAGESLSSAIAKQHFATLPETELHNEYGPTEATVWSSVHKVDRRDVGATIPIGSPIAGTTLWILDRQLQPVGWGAAGEICIESPSLATGYLNRPELDAGKFVEIDSSDGSRVRVYRTGDLGYRREDGKIVFAGRIDRQIKLRGHRIELEAIESVLESCPGVSQVRVTGWAPGKLEAPSKLIAWHTGASSASETQMRQFAADKLPHYMVPDKIMYLDSFPRLGNGKIDESSLPRISFGDTQDQIESPRNDDEIQMLAVWQTIFGFEQIGIHEDFFAIGGDSMSSIRLVSEARKVGFALESPAELIENRTIASLARAGSTSANATSKTVIQFNEVSRGMPIVCVHEGGKHAMYFRSLANYFPNRPFIALQSKGLYGGPRAESIEEVAAHHVRELDQLFGERPLHLVGYCKGSRVVLEMVHQLEEAGKKIGDWTIIDTQLFVEALPQKTFSGLMQQYRSYPIAAMKFANSIFQSLKRSIKGWVYKTWLNHSGEENRRILYQTLVELQSHKITRAYHPSPVHTPMTFISSAETEEKQRHLDWEEHIDCRSAVKNYTVGGIHDSMVLEPTVRRVAEILREQNAGYPND